MSEILGLDHLQLAMPPGQEEIARAFYGGVLGLVEEPKPANLVARGGVWFRSGSLRVHLGVDPDFHAARKAHPAFLVRGLAELAARCSAAGFRPVTDERLDGFDRVHVFDPFGNRIELMERTSASLRERNRTAGRNSPRMGAREGPPVTDMLRFPTAVKRDAAVDRWLKKHAGQLGAFAREWFSRMRVCGPDVRELLHDGCPVACVDDAAFGYVNVFTAHMNVGFFHGATLPDPEGLLVGTGKRMRHLKLRPGQAVDVAAIGALIDAAYVDVRARLKRV